MEAKLSTRYFTVNPRDESPTILGLGGPTFGVEVQLLISDLDGAPVVQIDSGPRARVRVNVNDGELATLEDGGDRITLPEHHREFHLPVADPTPDVAHRISALSPEASEVIEQCVQVVEACGGDAYNHSLIAEAVIARLQRTYRSKG